MAVGRRANGEGTVGKRADGRWEAKLAFTDPDTGKIRRKAFYGRSAKDVRAKLKAAQDRLADGQPVADASRTVADYLAQWRTTTLAVSDRRPTTRDLYGLICRKHLEPSSLGQQRLDRLKPTHVEALILALRAETKPGKGDGAEPVRKYSDSTIRQVYTVLRAALDSAVRDGLVAKNAAAAVQRPGIARIEARHLAPSDVTRVLDAARDSRNYPVLRLIAATGVRRGEALGLRWKDVDLEAGLLRVNGTLTRADGQLTWAEPKTARSRREIPLAPAMVTLLRRVRVEQKGERLRAANKWRETVDGLVFTTELGRPRDPRNLLRTMELAAKAAGVEGVGIHTLRHSAASAMLESGVNIKLVSDLLGHSSIAITGDTYGHSSQGAARQALEQLAGQLSGAKVDDNSDDNGTRNDPRARDAGVAKTSV